MTKESFNQVKGEILAILMEKKFAPEVNQAVIKAVLWDLTYKSPKMLSEQASRGQLESEP